jgi:beta-glucosidase
LSFDKSSVGPADDVTASVEVKNSGAAAADEVVQVYLSHPMVKGAPLRALVGFERVHLEPGETRRVRITIPNRNLSVVDEAGTAPVKNGNLKPGNVGQGGTRRIVPGEVQVWVGGGQPVSREGLPKTAGVRGAFTITGGEVLAK